MTLKGKWKTNRTRFYLVATGTTLLKRKNDFRASELYKKLDSLNLATKLSFIQPNNTVAIAAPPVIKKAVSPVAEPDEVTNKELISSPEPEEKIPMLASIDQLRNLSLLSFFSKKSQSLLLKVEPLSKQNKALYASLVKSNMVYKPKETEVVIADKKPAVVMPNKPAPETVTKTLPAPKPALAAPVVVKNNPPVAEKKPAESTVAASPVNRPPAPVFEAPSQQHGAAEIDKRVTKSDQSFYFESDSLLLTLYDNGEVDGDTVTVLMNGKVIFSKVGLTEKANSKTIYLTPNMDSVNLVMYAESLGDIPPNTGLLIVNDGEKRYDVRFSADLKTNSGILLRRKKKQ